MRTTIDIDDDLLHCAERIARANKETLGAVISDLARRGLNAPPRIKRVGPNQIPTFDVPPDAKPITLEDVKRIEDEP